MLVAAVCQMSKMASGKEKYSVEDVRRMLEESGSELEDSGDSDDSVGDPDFDIHQEQLAHGDDIHSERAVRDTEFSDESEEERETRTIVGKRGQRKERGERGRRGEGMRGVGRRGQMGRRGVGMRGQMARRGGVRMRGGGIGRRGVRMRGGGGRMCGRGIIRHHMDLDHDDGAQGDRADDLHMSDDDDDGAQGDRADDLHMSDDNDDGAQGDGDDMSDNDDPNQFELPDLDWNEAGDDYIPQDHPFTATPGLQVNTDGFSPADFYGLFLNDDFINHLSIQTNLFASQFLRDHPNLPPHSDARLDPHQPT